MRFYATSLSVIQAAIQISGLCEDTSHTQGVLNCQKAQGHPHVVTAYPLPAQWPDRGPRSC